MNLSYYSACFPFFTKIKFDFRVNIPTNFKIKKIISNTNYKAESIKTNTDKLNHLKSIVINKREIQQHPS